jgi:hypothetical protein
MKEVQGLLNEIKLLTDHQWKLIAFQLSNYNSYM